VASLVPFEEVVMDKAQFWRLIEEAKAKSGGDCEEQKEALIQGLKQLPPEDIVGFARFFSESIISAYRWDLWGAAVLINGGASDDGFEYFCRWLIAQGRATFEGALADPDALADLLPGDIEWGDAWLECEEIGYAAMDSYQEVRGQELDYADFPHYPGEPVGVKWSSDEELDAMLPRIRAKLPEIDEDEKLDRP